MSGTKFAFRRRCGWCGVRLRLWQANLCRRCRRTSDDRIASSPCQQGSRWDAAPDTWTVTI